MDECGSTCKLVFFYFTLLSHLFIFEHNTNIYFSSLMQLCFFYSIPFQITASCVFNLCLFETYLDLCTSYGNR